MAKSDILLVDDEQDIVKVLGRRLEMKGYNVDVAVDGEEALARVEQKRPQLIVLDIMLPKLNGYEVCAKLKQSEKNRSIPIIMFTAKGQAQDHLAGLMFGADAYVSKSCQFDDLHEQIQSLLEKSSAGS